LTAIAVLGRAFILQAAMRSYILFARDTEEKLLWTFHLEKTVAKLEKERFAFHACFSH
jgi:hypothetical protein